MPRVLIRYTPGRSPEIVPLADVPLPGLEAVRDTEHPLPPVATVPPADPNDFALTPPAETPLGQPRLPVDSQEPQP
jgi:hypothetical protein